MNQLNQTSYSGGICGKCGKSFCYVGDIPPEGWPVGSEPYCVCGTHICSKCGSRVPDKECEHD